MRGEWKQCWFSKIRLLKWCLDKDFKVATDCPSPECQDREISTADLLFIFQFILSRVILPCQRMEISTGTIPGLLLSSISLVIAPYSSRKPRLTLMHISSTPYPENSKHWIQKSWEQPPRKSWLAVLSFHTVRVFIVSWQVCNHFIRITFVTLV